MRRGDPRRDHARLRSGLLDRHAGRQAAEHPEVAVAAVLHGPQVVPHRRPTLDVLRKVEPGRRHADDFVRPAVDRERRPEHVGPPPEAALPERVGDHREVGRARLLLGGHEEPAQRGLDGQRREEGVRDQGAGHPLRLAIAGQHRVGPERVVGRQRPERVEPGPVVEVVHRRDRVPLAGGREAPDPHQAVRLGVRQRPQDDRLERAGHHGHGADADGHDERGSHRETRLLQQGPQGEPAVGGKRVEHRESPSAPQALRRRPTVCRRVAGGRQAQRQRVACARS